MACNQSFKKSFFILSNLSGDDEFDDFPESPGEYYIPYFIYDVILHCRYKKQGTADFFGEQWHFLSHEV